MEVVVEGEEEEGFPVEVGLLVEGGHLGDGLVEGEEEVLLSEGEEGLVIMPLRTTNQLNASFEPSFIHVFVSLRNLLLKPLANQFFD